MSFITYSVLSAHCHAGEGILESIPSLLWNFAMDFIYLHFSLNLRI